MILVNFQKIFEQKKPKKLKKKTKWPNFIDRLKFQLIFVKQTYNKGGKYRILFLLENPIILQKLKKKTTKLKFYAK